MGLGTALTSAISGLRVTQSALSIVSGNIANAETPGYVKKTVSQVAAASGGVTIGVHLSAINRELDQYVQRQLRTETSGGAYATQRADFYTRLQQIYGQPGEANALETVFNSFINAAQGLATSPDSTTARYSVLTAAQTLTQHLNGMTADIQSLRSDAELGLADAVVQANEAMRQIANINQQLGVSGVEDATAATLRDRRDFYLDQLAELMDIKVVAAGHNQINVFTASGAQLVGDKASTLVFDAKGALGAASQWSSDPTTRSAGTILLDSGAGANVDLIAGKAFNSGKIAALIEMRDTVLVEAQAQIDEIAAAMSRALSDRTTAGSAVTSGAQAGFDVDIGALLAGNTVNITYTDASNTQRRITIVRVDDPSVLPLPATATSDANDKVVGVDFAGGMASVLAQISSALGSTGLQFSNPGGTTLRVLDDGASGNIDVDALATTRTVTSLTGGSSELPFFLDGGTPYSGAITSSGKQSLGFAGRITVNGALMADPSRLVIYQTSPLTPAGDPTRPNFLYDRLTTAILDYAPQAGVGTVAAPFAGSLSSYIRQVISQQGEAAATATTLAEGQEIVVNTLQQRFADQSNVNIDEEMANLLKLQSAYSANARVMSTVRDMLEMLMRL